MKLLIIIAIVVVLAIVVVATSRSGPRVTTITRRKVQDEEREDRDA
jgi:hypothetical protein